MWSRLTTGTSAGLFPRPYTVSPSRVPSSQTLYHPRPCMPFTSHQPRPRIIRLNVPANPRRNYSLFRKSEITAKTGVGAGSGPGQTTIFVTNTLEDVELKRELESEAEEDPDRSHEGGKRMVTDRIRTDHASIQELYERYMHVSPLTPKEAQLFQKQKIVNEIVREVSMHIFAEELVIYPLITKYDIALHIDGQDSLSATATGHHLRQAHRRIKKDFYVVDKMTVEEPEFDGHLDKAMATFIAHVQEEETYILPALEKKLDQDELKNLDFEYEREKDVGPTHPHPMMTPSEKPPWFEEISLLCVKKLRQNQGCRAHVKSRKDPSTHIQKFPKSPRLRMSLPLPPPPPPPPKTASICTPSPPPPPPQARSPFVLDDSKGEVAFSFPDVPDQPGVVHLKAVCRAYVPGFSTKSVAPRQLFHVLGKLRALATLVDAYNTGIGSEDVYYKRYVCVQTLQLLSGFGFYVSKPTDRVTIDGLGGLISAVENVFAEEIKETKALIDQNAITFDGLSELYRPGTVVAGMTSCGELTGFRVVHGFFEERRTLFGFEKSFHLQLEFLAAVGADVAVVSFEEVMSGWSSGAKTKPIQDLVYVPATKEQIEAFTTQGRIFAEYAVGGQRFLSHAAGGFFIHGGASHGGMSTSRSSQINSEGRIMVDVARGSVLGHHPTQGSDEASHALITMTGRYRRTAADTKDNLTLFQNVPETLLQVTWPALVGFSFSVKAWGHVLVSSLRPIKFNDRAFDELVLDPNRKRLIRALVRFGGTPFDDIISGKSGGSVFLCYGPPGTGKTLTAEAIAEVLHRPLYYVTMGELGTTPETMEQRLNDVLTLCAGWDALTLIDEADVFLEKRSTSDVLRNAMVCVMLKILEYHPGILFLTTNRVTEFDPAFESRVTVALKYDHLPPEARTQVWKNLVARVPIQVGELNYDALGTHVLNGRQIKNAVRLAYALAEDAGQPLKQEFVDQTISIISLARSEMATAEKY
ncbi:hypothetical protein HK102_013838 [Quaeritorhiza haematococci]|nr:hypothetical protein HK102_013838 [Quaeritorhiza haematococci]